MKGKRTFAHVHFGGLRDLFVRFMNFGFSFGAAAICRVRTTGATDVLHFEQVKKKKKLNIMHKNVLIFHTSRKEKVYFFHRFGQRWRRHVHEIVYSV